MELADETKSTTKAIRRVLKKTGVTYEFTDKANQINAASSMRVSATDHAGGILGYAKMTSVGDVLGGTVSAATICVLNAKNAQ